LVLVGENNSWDAWNASILSIVGGGFVSGCFYDVGTTISSHSLVTGVGSVEDVCGSQLTTAGSPDLLFDNDFIGVYSVGTGEALVFLDSNWNADSYINNYDNAVFAQNIADWIGDSSQPPLSPVAVPVPGLGPLSLILLACLMLLGGIAGFRRQT